MLGPGPDSRRLPAGHEDQAGGDRLDRASQPDIVDELATKLTGHLDHEEPDGLALIDASLTSAA